MPSGEPGGEWRENPERDSTALTIVRLDFSTLETLKAPTYRFVHREQWRGENHLRLFGWLKAMVETWHPQQVVMDASGVGEGLWAMLDRSFPGRVRPVRLNRQSKSELGWRYLAIIETGRVRDCCPEARVRLQYDACQAEVLVGPGKTLRWQVPEGKRSPDGELVHDDALMADALVAELDRLEWVSRSEPLIVRAQDPIPGMESYF
jgi:hypothetical protein